MEPCLIAGLGNPGPRYEGTRHNLGFEVIDILADRLHVRLTPADGPALAGRTDVNGIGIILLKPLTYMNNSGEAVAAFLDRTGVLMERLLIVLDDTALPLGAIRMRPGGSDGGHNGLASVVEKLGTTGFPRLRMGIAGAEPPPEGMMATYVLSRFEKQEHEEVRAMTARAADACRSFAEEGLAAAMNRFNTAASSKGPFAAEP